MCALTAAAYPALCQLLIRRFNRDIRKLGVTDEGATFLDHFRVLVTEVCHPPTHPKPTCPSPRRPQRAHHTPHCRRGAVTRKDATHARLTRPLSSQVGNALGLVRMVRLGAMHYCNDAAKFVPDVARARNLAAAVKAQGLSKESAAAAANVDLVLENLRANTVRDCVVWCGVVCACLSWRRAEVETRPVALRRRRAALASGALRPAACLV